MRLGAVNFVSKPADADDVLHAFEVDGPAGRPEPHGGVEAPSLARAEWEHIQRILADVGGMFPKPRGAWGFIAGRSSAAS